MDIHPIIVHFPIALLSLYTIAECIPLRLAAKIKGFNSIKLAFLFIGTVGAVVAGATGLIAAEGITGTAAHLVHAHKTFAMITILYFFGICTLYMLLFLREKPIRMKSRLSRIIHGSIAERKIYIFMKLRVLFALIGLVLITLTGGLGGIIVYGPIIDPFANFIYRILFKG